MANEHTRRDAVSGSGDITADWGPQGLQITDARPRPVWARITGVAGGTNRYSWVQINEADTTLPDWGSGFAMAGSTTVGQWPAYEVTGNGSVATGTKVQIWPSPGGQFWLFYSPAALGGGTAFIGTQQSDQGPLTYDITTDDTWEDPGITITTAAAGTFLAYANVTIEAEADGPGIVEVCINSDGTRERIGAMTAGVAQTNKATITLVVHLTLASFPKTIKVQAYRYSGVTWTTSRVIGGVRGELQVVRLT